MPRTLSTSAAAQAARVNGAEPVLILRIDWGGATGTKFYADRALSSPVTAQARIMNAGDVALALGERGVHAAGEVRVDLSDHDGALMTLCAAISLPLKSATLYQWFSGTGVDDMIVLMRGRIDDPVEWTEDGRTLSFAVVDSLLGDDITIGHTATRADFPGIAESVEGTVLPLVFGRVERMKCVPVSGGLTGTLLRDMLSDAQTLYIEGGEDFPQNASTTIRILEESIVGIFNGRRFTITSRTVRYGRVFAGATVRLDQPYVLIANDARSLRIKRVFGLQNFKIRSGRTGTRDVQHLVEMPTDIYTANVNDTTTFASLGRAVTTLTFTVAPTHLEDCEWASDDVFVEIDGYTRDGSTLLENPADVIRYLLQDFGSVADGNIDSSSFTAARSSLTNTPFAFALREQKSLRELVADLAFQSRCALLSLAGRLYLYFADDNPGASQFTLADTNVEEESITRGWIPVADVWSEVVASYAPDLAGLDESEQRKVTLQDATALSSWGRRSQDLDLWAIRDNSAAKVVAQHYLNAHARPWQTAKLVTFLQSLELQPLDWVSLGSISYWSSGQLARVQAARLQPGDETTPDRIEYEVRLPVYAGCSGTCEVACEAGGCEADAEHGGVSSCLTACEASCQEACQLVCVTTCQASCQLACETSCESTEEVQDPEFAFALTADANVQRGVAFNLSIQSIVAATSANDTGYAPSGTVSISLEQGGDDAISPTGTASTGWSSGAKTVSVTLSGGSGPAEVTLRVEDRATDRVGTVTLTVADADDPGFDLSAPASVAPLQAFDLDIAAVTLDDGAAETSYTPAGNVAIVAMPMVGVLPSGTVAISPALTDNSGWTNGAKTVSCTLPADAAGKTVRIYATDGERAGYVDVACAAAAYAFKLTAPANVQRGVAFNLAIQSIEAGGADDTAYTPTGNVTIADNSAGDSVSPTTTDSSGWTSGAKTVAVTLSGGSGSGAVRLTVTDPATGRTGTADVLLADSGDPGFALSASGVVRYQAFDLTLQAVTAHDGSSDTGYTPAGTVTITDSAAALTPDSTDNTGWASGAKAVASALVAASNNYGVIVEADDGAGRTGKALLKSSAEATPASWDGSGPVIEVSEPTHTFVLEVASASVRRGYAVDVTIKSVVAATNQLDTAYTPTGDVSIFTDHAEDLADPVSTDNTGWTSGAKTVSVTIDGSSGTQTVNLYAHDLATGRIGSVALSVAQAYGFDLLAVPDAVTAPDTGIASGTFDLTIQSILLPSGDPDTSFAGGDGYLQLTSDHAEYLPDPAHVNDIGWVDGAKTISGCRFILGTGHATVRLTAIQSELGETIREGYTDIEVGTDGGFFVYPDQFSGDLCTGGSPLGSASYSGFVPERAFDDSGLNASEFVTLNQNPGVKLNDYIGYQFSAARDIRRITISQGASYPAGYGSEYRYGVDSVVVQYSDDGTIWSTAQTFHGLTTYGLSTLDLGVSHGSHTYWRMLANSEVASGGVDTRWAVKEVQMMSANLTVSRDLPFNLNIQAFVISSGALDDAYVPAGDVTIDDSSSDASDDLLPAYTSSSGWTVGAKTVACTISGGSGSDTCRVTVTDPLTGRTGYADLVVED